VYETRFTKGVRTIDIYLHHHRYCLFAQNKKVYKKAQLTQMLAHDSAAT